MSDVGIIPTDLGGLIREARKAQAKFATHGQRAAAVVVVLVAWRWLGSLLAALLVLGVVLASVSLVGFARWARTRRRDLLAASLPVPSLRVLWAVRRAERKRLAALVSQWPTRCADLGLKLGGRTPVLVDHRLDLDGNITAKLIRTGHDPADVAAKSTKLSKSLGCHSVTVRETAPGAADVRFSWSDPLRRELPLRDLQWPKHGGVVVGDTEHGDPAELRLNASKSFVGASGSGKSNAAEAALAGLVARGEHVRLFVSNPKRNELQEFKRYEKQAKGRFEVRAYAETEDENRAMVKQFHHAMTVRNGQMKNRKLTKTSRANPLCILWLDEMMMLPKDTYKDGPYSPLGQCCLAGRASLYTVWGCSQMFYASDFGTVRNLFDERLLFRVKTKTQADTVIDGAVDRGAYPHKLRAKKDAGIGWIEAEEDDNQLVRFRAAMVTDADLDCILHGKAPAGMKTEPDPEPEPVEPLHKGRALLVMLWRAVKAVLAPLRRRARGILPALHRTGLTTSFGLRQLVTAVRISTTVPLAQLRAGMERRANGAAISAAVFATVLVGMLG